MIFALSVILIAACVNTKSVEDEPSWRFSYDFDKDEKKDSINYTDTGGAHCCYRLKVNLSSLQEEIEIPYLIEGGYMIFDLSKPDNFNIYDADEDGLPEIYFKGEYVGAETENSGEIEQIYVDFEKREKYYNFVKYKNLKEE